MKSPATHEEYFDALAPTWEERVSPRAQAAVADVAAAMALPVGAVVLDLGSGTGVAIPALREALGPGGSVVALDISRGMLEQARRRYGETGIAFLQADGEALPFAPAAFAAILCNATFPHFRDKPAALREMVRVLAPGGSAYITHPVGRQRTNEIHQRAGGVIRLDRVPEGSEMRAMMEDAGFTAVTVHDGPEGYVAQGRRPEKM